VLGRWSSTPSSEKKTHTHAKKPTQKLGKENLEYMTRNLKETHEKLGLDMNLNKIKL